MFTSILHPKPGRYWKPIGIFFAIFGLLILLPNMISRHFYYTNKEFMSEQYIRELTLGKYIQQQLTLLLLFGLLFISGIGMILKKKWGGRLAFIMLLIHFTNAAWIITSKIAYSMIQNRPIGNLSFGIIYLLIILSLYYLIFMEQGKVKRQLT